MRWSPRFATLLLLGTLCQVPQAAAAPAPPPPRQTRSVTLITGDKVVLGADSQVTIMPGDGRDGIGFVKEARDGHIVVLPTDALDPVNTGAVDEKLFDVTELLAQGRDDQSRSTLPLLLEHKVSGVEITAELPGLTAVSASKQHLGALWDQLRHGKVWLDGVARLDDSESNAQIGVPQAWQAGLTGKGVTVAVLDGGYDQSHPDLKDAVTESRDFTGSGIQDTYGHGTHVASTIAGSGTASAGRYAGVAPDAKLLVGKVCRADTCDYSAILAGMQWAAPRAKIVSLSLGGAATDGTDPLATAVNQLSAQYGTLFVIAAGNTGSAKSVGSPASADAALAVASVSKTDKLSSFSSRGPRVGDYALKPDIAAPGEAIVAARAAGTSMGSPVDANYTSSNGTSMATPHVSGSAALLAQQHPDWAGAALKTALMATAKPVNRTAYEVGAGRVDLGALTTAKVVASPPSLSFGYLRFPQTGLPPITKAVTYTNEGDAPVTLNLSQPHAAFTLSASQLTVPAHAKSTVDVTVDPAKLLVDKVTSIDATLTASAGTSSIRTTLGVTSEPESYDVTVKLFDRDGKPVDAELGQYLRMVRLDVAGGATPMLTGGVATIRVYKGDYAFNAMISSPGPNRTWLSTPKITIDRDTEITLDARTGKKLTVQLDRPAPERKFAQVDALYVANGSTSAYGFTSRGAEDLYATPVKADPAYFRFGVYQVLASTFEAYYLALPSPGAIPENLALRVRDADLGAQFAQYRAQGMPVIGTRSSVPFYLPGQFVAFGVSIDLPLPQRRVEWYSAGDIKWTFDLFQRPLGVPAQVDLDGHVGMLKRTFTPGQRDARTWNSAVLGTDIDLHPPNGVSRTNDSIYAQVWPFAPSERDQSDEFVFGSPYINAKTSLSTADGTPIGSNGSVYGSFRVAAERGRYLLDVQASRSPKWSTLATEVSTRWSFTSERPAKGGFLPLLTVRTSAPLDDLNRAPAFSLLPLDITVGRQTGTESTAKIKRVSAEMSTDDGKTWQRIWVLGSTGDVWKAVLFNPPGKDFVSLRVKAEDSAGDSVEQTTIRAWALHAP